MTVASFLWGNYGRLAAKPAFAALVSVVVIAVNLGLIIGGEIWNVPLATEISKLWIDPNSQVAANNKIVEQFGSTTDLGFNEFITLTSKDGSSMTKPENMELWKQMTQRVMDTVVEYNGTYFTVFDVCNGRNGQVAYSFGCSANNPLDYFREGKVFFPEEAVAQWLLDTKLAWAYVDLGAGATPDGKAFLWKWAILADTASRGSIVFYNNWFVQKCMKSSKLFCDDNDELYDQIDELINKEGFPKLGKFQFAWAKSQLMLAGLYGTFLPGGDNDEVADGTCGTDPANDHDGQTTTVTDTVTLTAASPEDQVFLGTLSHLGFPNGQTFSLSNCAFKLSGDCDSGPTACPLTDLQAVNMLNFSSPCASCILAGMWWNGDFGKIQEGLVPSGPAAAGIFSATQYPISVVPAYVKALTLGAAEFIRTNVCPTLTASPTSISPEDCDALWDSFKDRTIEALDAEEDEQAQIAELGADERAEILAQYDFLPDEELIAVNAALGGRAGMDAAWRNLLRQGAIPPVKSALLRFEDRPLLAGMTEANIAKTLSGFKNDLATQNLRAAVFGGAVPHPRDLVPGRCDCDAGYAGLNCQLDEDPICDCDATLKQSCLTGLLESCVQIAPCAGYQTISGLIAAAGNLGIADQLGAFANFKKEMVVAASFGVNQTTSTGVLLQHCQAYLPCVDIANFADPTLPFGLMAPSSYSGILADATWNFALISDLSGGAGSFGARANVLLQRFFLVSQVADTTTAISTLNDDFEGDIGFNITVDDAATFTCGAGPSGIGGCTSTLLDSANVPATLDSAGVCDNTVTLLGASPKWTVFGYFACLAESGRATSAASFAPKGSDPVKNGYCTSGAAPDDGVVTDGLNKAQCIAAMGTFLFQGVDKVLDTLPEIARPSQIQALFSATDGTLTNFAQRSAQSQGFVAILGANEVFLNSVSGAVFASCTTKTYEACEAIQDQVDVTLEEQCIASKANFVEHALEVDACETLVTNLGGAVLKDATAINTVSKALAKYKFMGTIFGACSATGGSALGGGECWENSDCGAHGTCANLSAAKPFESIKTLAMILQTNSPNGTLSYMRKADRKYRELANKPIFDRYKDRLEADSRRRLDDIDFGELGPVSWLTEEDADQILQLWRLQVVENLKEFGAETPTARADLVTADSASNLLDEISEANPAMLVLGYGLMLLYTFLSCTNWSTDVPAMLNGSRALVGMTGIILVALSVASGLGISRLAGIEWSAAATQIVPFVMLGLGVSDTFVLLRIFPYYQDGLSPAEAAAKALTVAGPPMLLVSATNVGVFAIGVLTAMPVVVNFALQATIVTITNYFSTNLMMPALLVLDYKRMAAGRMDMAPCVHVGTSARAQVASETTGYEMNVYNRFCTPTYVKCLLSIPGKIFVIALSFALLGSAIYGVEVVSELGLQLADIAPAGSDLASALLTRDENFGFYTISLATGEANWAKREVQQGIIKVYADVMATEKVVDGSGNPWMQAFMSWGQMSTPNYDIEDEGQLCHPQNPRTGGKCGADPEFNCQVITDDDSVVQGGIPFYAENDFYRCLEAWINNDLAYEALKPGFKLVDEFAPKGSRELFYSRDDETGKYLPFSTGLLITLGLSTNADFVQLINEVRAVANSETTPPTFPLGEPFDFFDQYLSLREVINTAVGYSLLICFITIFILLLCLVEGDAGIVKRLFATFWGAALTTGVIAMTVYQLFGYMAFAQLKISAIPAISIIMSTGVAVEYTAYTAVAFINGQGTMNERAEHSLMLMLAPVVDGGITMFLGVVMLAASPFLFIVKYFFYPWLLIIFFGLFNGLAFLPVLFSLVGPPAVKSGSRTMDSGASKEVAAKE